MWGGLSQGVKQTWFVKTVTGKCDHLCVFLWDFPSLKKMFHYISIITNIDHFDGLVQERRNSSALAMELRLSCNNPLI